MGEECPGVGRDDSKLSPALGRGTGPLPDLYLLLSHTPILLHPPLIPTRPNLNPPHHATATSSPPLLFPSPALSALDPISPQPKINPNEPNRPAIETPTPLPGTQSGRTRCAHQTRPGTGATVGDFVFVGTFKLGLEDRTRFGKSRGREGKRGGGRREGNNDPNTAAQPGRFAMIT